MIRMLMTQPRARHTLCSSEWCCFSYLEVYSPTHLIGMIRRLMSMSHVLGRDSTCANNNGLLFRRRVRQQARENVPK